MKNRNHKREIEEAYKLCDLIAMIESGYYPYTLEPFDRFDAAHLSIVLKGALEDKQRIDWLADRDNTSLRDAIDAAMEMKRQTK